VLQWMFDKQVQLGDARADGRVAVSIGCQNVERCAAEIAGFGDRIEVTGPPEARAFLARLGEQLVHSYRANDEIPAARSSYGRKG